MLSAINDDRCGIMPVYFDTISAPNGRSDSFAILKNCFPNGMPMIVMHQSSPKIRFSRAIHTPKNTTQITFASIDTAPPPYCTSFPNGKNESDANLKHCFPYGIPIIVMHQSAPETSHESPLKKPPNINHKILPIVPIFLLLSSE